MSRKLKMNVVTELGDEDISKINLLNLNEVITTDGESVPGITFCSSLNLLPVIKDHDCIFCSDGIMRPKKDDKFKFGFRFRCNKCAKTINVTQNTWFFNSKLDLRKNLLLIYLWVMRTPANVACEMLGVNKNTVTDWYQFIRDVISSLSLSPSLSL